MTLRLVESPHVQQMRLTLIAARLVEPLQHAIAEFHGLEDATLTNERRLELLSVLGEVIRDGGPERCIVCSAHPQRPGSSFCSEQCAIWAENERD